MEHGKIHRLETLIILQISQARLPATFQEGKRTKDQKTDRRQTAAVEPTDRYPSAQENLVLCVNCLPSYMTVSCQGCIVPGAHADPERVTQFIFRHILGHFFL